MRNTLVNFILSYFRFFARQALKRHRPTIIGITGSMGKSSARTILYAILKDHFPTKIVAENSEIGMPLGILGIKPRSLGFETLGKSIIDWSRMLLRAPFSVNNLKGIKYLIVEMGIDDPYPPKNMEYLLTIIKPDIALLLNAGPVHTMQFEKVLEKTNEVFKTGDEKTAYLIQQIANEKAKIITQSGCEIGIYNADNEYITTALKDFVFIKEKPNTLLTFGEKATNDILYKEYDVDLEGTTFSFIIKASKAPFNITIKNYVLQQEYQQTLAAAILAGLQTGLTPEQIKIALEKHFTLPKGRASLLKGIHSSILIDSSYNASRIATEGMLDLVANLKKQTKRPVVFLFGDMRELGNETQSEHEAVTRKLLPIVDYLYCVGEQTRNYVLAETDKHKHNLKEIRWFDTSLRAGEYLQANLPKDAIVLVKGSQNTIFLEEAVRYILADKNDEKNLCRQEVHWLKTKKAYFSL